MLKHKFKAAPLLLVILLFLGILLSPAISGAATLEESFEELKDDPEFAQYLMTMEDNGASEDQVIAYLEDIDRELSKVNNLNESNLNEHVLEAWWTLADDPEHTDVNNALLLGFAEEMDYIFRGEIPLSMIPLRNVISAMILEDEDDGLAAGGGGGGGLPQEDEDQGNELGMVSIGDGQIELKIDVAKLGLQLANENANTVYIDLSQMTEKLKKVSIPVNGLIQAAAANKPLEVDLGGLTVNLDLSSIKLGEGNESGKNFVLEVNERDAGEQDNDVVGKIYDISLHQEGGNGASENVAAEVTFDLGEDIDEEEISSLRVFWFNEETKSWDYVGGRVDGQNRRINVKLNHFSQYAIRKMPQIFDDLPQAHWARETVESLVSRNIVHGVTNNKFMPGKTVTRAEFATLLMNTFKISYSGTHDRVYSDIGENDWYYQAIMAVSEAGIVHGYSDGTFKPQKEISREEMAVMIINAIQLEDNSLISNDLTDDQITKFSDSETISGWAINEAAQAVKLGIINGRTAGVFAPKEKATRAEGATMIKLMWEVLHRI